MEYEDFTIDIRSTADDQLEVAVVDAPIQDRPRALCPRPLSEAVVEELFEAAERRVKAVDEETSARAAEESEPKEPTAGELSPRVVGQNLHRALFGSEVGALYRDCLSATVSKASRGLRLRLGFDLDDPEAEYLAALPWELLNDPKTDEFMASDIARPVVRQLANPHLRKPLPVAGPLRILVVDAAPSTMKALDLRLEIERMEEALLPLTSTGRAQLLQLDEASPEALRDALRDEDVHVLHFMGHGGYHRGSGMGALFFVAADGGTDQVDGEMLGAMLKRIDSLRLVVLNACKTARHAGRTGAPLCFGAASGIIDRTGMPAVVATQHAISDTAAVAFSKTFYDRLAALDPVDTALSEARLRLSWRTPEWTTPVLFLSAPDGKIFAGEAPPAGRARTTVRAPRSGHAPAPAGRSAPEILRLGVRSFIGWGGDMEEHCAEVCDLTEFFDPASPNGRFVREPRLWQDEIFPRLRTFLLENVEERWPLHLDFAAHQSIAFAAGWVLEAKSGLDVQVRQRTQGKPLDWHPDEGEVPEGELWQQRPDLELPRGGSETAVALSISNADVAPEVCDFVTRQVPEVGRIIDASLPVPGQRSILGGRHALVLAQALANRLRRRRPGETERRLHLMSSAPNAFQFYFGQLSRALGTLVLYEYAFNVPGGYSRYQRSIELPPPGESPRLPPDW